MLIGLVGKPSCGKSTFFKAATLAEVEIASYPFTTIKPNHGIGYVRIDCIDKEFGKQCNPRYGFCINHQRFVPIDLIDVAGLVPGASEGKGLGNQFLDELRQADVFLHIVDASGETDIEGKPTKNYDVSKDIEFLENELDNWYCNILKKVWKSFARKAEIEKENFAKSVAKQFSGLKVSDDDVKDVLRKLNFSGKASEWNEKQISKFASELRKMTKPMIIAANKVDTSDGKKNYEKLKKEFPHLMIVPCSADSEVALRQAAKAGLIEYIPGDNDFKIVGSPRDTLSGHENLQAGDSGEPKYELKDLCYSMQETVFAMLVETAERALAHTGKKELLLGGGVACNSRLQEMCRIMCSERGAKLFVPEKSLLVDNGAMIAYLGEIMFKKKIYETNLEKIDIHPRERTDEVEVKWK